MSWKLVASSVPTEIGPYKVESERDGDRTAHLITFPDDRQIRVLPDDVHSGQYRIRVIKGTLITLAALDTESGFLPAGYDPKVYLLGALCFHKMEWEHIWTEPNLVDWLTVYFGEAAPIFEVDTSDFLSGLKQAGWVIRREDEG